MTATHPLLEGFDAHDAIGWRAGVAVSAAQFCAAAVELARTLPRRRYVLNLCEDRLNFMLAFAAALVARQTSLLPQSRADASLRELHASHPDSYCVADGAELPAGLPAVLVPPWPSAAAAAPAEAPGIEHAHVAIIAFTSGSTGRPRPHSRTWGSLVTAAKLLNRRLALEPHGRAAIVGTVPPQHVYGFESTVMLPLKSGAAVHPGRPLLPADIDAALEAVRGARWLATTPAHLRVCVAAAARLPALSGIVSATMPLPADLARAAERLGATRVHEIYGCTETGVIALRQPAREERWRLTDGMRLVRKGEEAWLEGGQLERPARVPDRISAASDTEFTLLGRPEDMVKIAGKRASLEALNQELLRIRGVRDGAFFVPEPAAAGARLAAVIVAPALDRKAVLAALRERIDPAFLPRPLLLLDALPRNSTGKLPREALLALARAHARGDRSA